MGGHGDHKPLAAAASHGLDGTVTADGHYGCSRPASRGPHVAFAERQYGFLACLTQSERHARVRRVFLAGPILPPARGPRNETPATKPARPLRRGPGRAAVGFKRQWSLLSMRQAPPAARSTGGRPAAAAQARLSGNHDAASFPLAALLPAAGGPRPEGLASVID